MLYMFSLSLQCVENRNIYKIECIRYIMVITNNKIMSQHGKKNKKNLFLSMGDVMRINKQIKHNNLINKNGVKNVTIPIPKSHKIVGLSICGLSFVSVGCDVVTIPMGLSVMMSPKKRDILPTFTRLFVKNVKRLIKTGKNVYSIVRCDKNGVKRW